MPSGRTTHQRWSGNSCPAGTRGGQIAVAGSVAAPIKTPPDVIDRCQNHALLGSKVRRHYLHYDYADEKREAWRLLGERLDLILTGGNVVPLPRHKHATSVEASKEPMSGVRRRQ